MKHNNESNNYYCNGYLSRCCEPFSKVPVLFRVLSCQRFSPFSHIRHLNVTYIPGIDGIEGNNPNICKNKNMPIAKLAIQRTAVIRIHFFKFFLGRTPKT